MQKLKLITSDKKEIIVNREDIQCSGTILSILKKITTMELQPNDDSTPIEIPLTTIKFNVLEKILEWMRAHKNDPLLNVSCDDRIEDLNGFDLEFTNIDVGVLYEYTIAANCLDIKSLKYVTCKAISDLIRGKPAYFIDMIFPEMCPENERRRPSQHNNNTQRRYKNVK